MIIDYIHLFDFGAQKLSSTNGRQLNFLDYSQHFSKTAPEIRNLLLYDQKSFVETFENFFYHPSIQELRTVDMSIYRYITTEHFDNPGEFLLLDFWTLMILVQKNVPLEKYKKIFIFDCLELTVFLRNLAVPKGIESAYKGIDLPKIGTFLRENPCTLLCTHYNEKDAQNFGLGYQIYYKKINFGLFDEKFIKNLTKAPKMCYYSAIQNATLIEYGDFLKQIRAKYPEVQLVQDFLSVWNYEKILYTQKPYVGYIEQFGRMIFELRHFGYEVRIDDFLKREEKTGLDFYLEFYAGEIPDLGLENFLEELQGLNPN